jgi:hypothetical protein
VPFNPFTYFEQTRIEPATAFSILEELRYQNPAENSSAVHDRGMEDPADPASD